MSDNREALAAGRTAALRSFGRCDDPAGHVLDGAGFDRSAFEAGAAAARAILGKPEPSSEDADIYERREAMVRARAAQIRNSLPRRSTALPRGSLIGRGRD